MKHVLRKRFWFNVIDFDEGFLKDKNLLGNNENSFFWSTGSISEIHNEQKRSGSISNYSPLVIHDGLLEQKKLNNQINSSQVLRIQSSTPITLSSSPNKIEKKDTSEMNYNCKILSPQDMEQVENYILSDGHIIPY